MRRKSFSIGNQEVLNNKYMLWYEMLGKTPKKKTNGILIVLNGTSSSGKSAIAKALQELLFKKVNESYLNYSSDHFVYLASPSIFTNQDSMVENLPRLAYAFQETIPPILKSGISIILDHVLHEEEWAKHLINLTKDFTSVYIKIDCPIEILEKRESERGDREIGLARYQKDRIHYGFLPYKLSVDTSRNTAIHNAELIFDFLKSGQYI